MKTILAFAFALGLMLSGQASSADQKFLTPEEGISCRGQDLPDFRVDLSPTDRVGSRVLRLNNWPTPDGDIIRDQLREYVRECIHRTVYPWCNGEGLYDNGPSYTGHFQLNLNTLEVQIGSKSHKLICE